MARRFDRDEESIKDLKNQPISVVQTEIPALAKALGVSTKDLLHLAGATFERSAEGGGAAFTCCNNDSW